jgi:hypothetical protein
MRFDWREAAGCGVGSERDWQRLGWQPSRFLSDRAETECAFARQSTTRAWAIIRRADRAHRLSSQRTSRSDRRHADRAGRSDRTHQPQERESLADTR